MSSSFSLPPSWDLLLIFQEPEDEVFLAIAKAMEENVDCYWIIQCFVNQLNNKYQDSLPRLAEGFFSFFFLLLGEWAVVLGIIRE
jgi:hypothetical protein